MLPPLHSLFRLCFLTAMLCSGLWLNAQSDSAAFSKPPRLSRGEERDPKLLVEALTAGKTGDREKFDALFSWVATNIRYDYRQYFSGEGAGAETDIHEILRRKRAICFQYAALMDHLCGLAGIQNVTITGYAKDQLFDVNDSLYFDNHAWNAVKLDDRWHLYDITWSAGGYEYRLTRFSERIQRWRQSIAANKPKLRKEVIKIRIAENRFCGIRAHKEKKVRMVMRLPFFWRVTDRVLSWFSMRYTVDYGKVKDRNYYLTDPRLFAITHFPNVPYWSLTSGISNLQEFSADSVYYHYEKSISFVQTREGTACVPCDDFLALAPLEQKKHAIRMSQANNPHNGLAPAIDCFGIAQIFLKDAAAASDSLEKVTGYDSTLFYLNLARNELQRSNPQNTAFHHFHFDKEAKKVKQVREACQAHNAVNSANVTELRSRANKMRLMGNKLNALQRKYLRSYRALDRFRPRTPAPKPMNEGTEKHVRERLAFHESRIDSLDDRVRELEVALIDRIGQLSDNIWEQSRLLYPQYGFFRKSIYSRYVSLLDNRDKFVVQLHDSIRKYESDLSASIGEKILLPSDTLYSDFRELEKCSRLRDADQLKALRLYGQLYVGNAATLAEVTEARERFKENDRRDFCYFYERKLPLVDFSIGYKRFRADLYALYGFIKTDMKAETFRHKTFLKEILLTKKRVRHVISMNLRYDAELKKKVMRARREYIREQKKLQKED